MVSVPYYNYYWGFTSAQIELMMSDLPLVVYPRKKDKNGGTRLLTDEDYEKRLREWSANAGKRPKLNIRLKDFNIEGRALQ